LTLPPVVKSVTVRCEREKAFRYFTEDFSKWWPGASHSVVAFSSGFKESPLLCDLEAKPGGKIFEKASNGDIHNWGTIVLWEPPSRLAFTWHPGSPADSAQRVEITFSTVRDGTLVKLSHTGWEKLGAAAEDAWKGYDNGWESVFSVSFAGYANENSAAGEFHE
jgi:uncharacterized protein YndB with AHSA1/START domain